MNGEVQGESNELNLAVSFYKYDYCEVNSNLWLEIITLR